jgi:predicted aspartyl protease
MKTPYSTDYHPPIPMVPVHFGYNGNPFSIGPYDAIVDTGADATIIPETIAKKLHATPLNTGQLRTQWGDMHPVTLYVLDVTIGDQKLPGIVVAGDPTTEEIVLGRDVLNKLQLFLDGLEQTTHLLDATTARRLQTRKT